MSTSIGGGAVFFGEEVAAGWERRLAVAPSSSTRCCGGRRVGGGINVAELAGRWYVTVGLVTVITAVVGGVVSRGGCAGCCLLGLAAGAVTARARLLVGCGSRSCRSSVISIFTFRLPSDMVHKGFPVKAKADKAWRKVEGSSKLAAIVG